MHCRRKRTKMFYKCSLETIMKWIFMALALSMVTLTLGARLHQSYVFKKDNAANFGDELKIDIEKRKYYIPKDIVMGELGPYWREASPNEKAELTIRSGESIWGFIRDPQAIMISLVEEERYLLLVGLLGLIAAVELAVFISYILTRPLRRLAWGCREIADGVTVTIPQNKLAPYEFHELTNSFNIMAKQLEKWKEVQRQLSRMDRLAALGEMISGLSHEIRNPLASIRIQLDLLRMELELLSEKKEKLGTNDINDAKEHIGILEHEIDRLNSIVTQLLSFVRPKQVIIAPVLLDDLLPWCRSMLKAQAEKQGIELVTRQLDKNVTVMADNEMLQQLLMNLSLNAIQSMSLADSTHKKILLITAGYSKDQYGIRKKGLLKVRDTGPGIPSEIQHRIFDPFFTTRQDGTGLGLSIVQRIIEGLGGSLSMETSSSGTSFNVFIPLDDNSGHVVKKEIAEDLNDEYLDS